MSITRVQGNSGNSTNPATSIAVTTSSGVTLGNLLIAHIMVGNNATTMTGPSGWTQAVLNQPSGVNNTIQTSIWWLVVDAGHAGGTSWTWTASASHTLYFVVEEWSSSVGWPASPVDQTATGNATGTSTATTIVSGTTSTTTQNEELWIASLSYKNAPQTESGITSGWTKDLENSTSSNVVTALYQVASSTGAAACQYTIGTAEFWAGCVATFKDGNGTQVFKDVTTRGKISAKPFKDVTTRSKISARANKDITVRGRVGNTVFKDVTARGKLSASIFKDITARGRVSQLISKDITVRGNIIARNLSGGATCWANGTGTAQFDSLRVTQYPDPSAPMTNAGRANTSSVNWTANLPTNTTLAVSTSMDNGVTYQPATGNGLDVAGITTLLYSTLVLQRKPLAYYHFSDTGASASDASGNGNTGTLHGTITTSQPGVLAGPGEAGMGCMGFDGSTGYISLPSGLKTDGMSNLAIGCWFNPSGSPAYVARLLANDNPASTHNGIDLGINASLAGCFFTVGNGTTSATATFSTALATSTWYFLLATFDGVAGTINLYLNGVLKATTSLSGSIGTAASPLDIAQSPSISGKFFAGRIDELDIVNPTIANSVNPLSGTDALARYNAARVTGMATILDTFPVNSSANYTQSNFGGTTGTWTWDTTNSRLTGSSGVGGTLAYTSAVQLDGQFLLDTDQADGSGLIANLATDIAGNINLYYLQVFDSQASSNANSVMLFKRSGGVLTQLGATISVTFPRGTYHHFELDIKSGVLTVLMNGVQILQQTDGSPLVAGQAGLLLNTLLRVYTFQLTQIPRDLSAQSLVTQQVLSTTDPTATPQVTTHSAAAFGPQIDPGVVIPSADYRDTLVSANHDDLATQSNYDWYTDPSGNVWFKQRTAIPAPWIAQSSSAGNSISGLEVEHDNNFQVVVSGDLYRNRQVITNVYNIFSFTNTFAGSANSERVNFTLSYEVAKGTVPVITRNGNTQTVTLEGGSAQWYYKEGDKTVKLDQSQPDITLLETIVVTYTAQVKTTVQADNAPAQQALAALEGGTGIVEQITDGKGINTTAATTLANQLLTRYSQLGRTVTFKTYRNGLGVGQILLVNIPEEGLIRVRMYITEIDLTMQTLPGNQMLYGYIVTATELPNTGSWQKLIASSLIN